MTVIIEIISWILLLAGSLFTIIGAVGLIRLPDVFSRMHGAGIIDTMGAGMILVGLMFQAGLNIVTVKLVLILVFLVFTSPTTTHALARAILNDNVNPLPDSGVSREDRPSKT